MTLSFVAVGNDVGLTDTAAPFANVTPTLPAGMAADDLILLGVPCKPFSTTPGTPTDYTQQATITNGSVANVADGGSIRETVFYKVHDGTEANPAITWPAAYDPTQPCIAGFHKTAAGAWTIESTTGTDATSGSVSATGAATLNLVTGDWIVVCVACPTDVLHTVPALSVPGCTLGTLTQRVGDPNTTAGLDCSHYIYTAAVTAGTASGAPVFTATGTGNVGMVSVVFVRLAEPAGAIALTVQDAAQAQTADNVVLTVGGAVALTVQDATQAQTADNVDLVQHHQLAVQDAAQAQAADNVDLVQHHQLAVQDALQAQTADNVALIQHHVLAVQDALQAQTADNVVVTPHAPGAVQLVVQDAAQAQLADNVALIQHHVLVVQDALQAQTADSVVLILPAAGAQPSGVDAYVKAPWSEAGITDGVPDAPRVAAPTPPAAASGGGRGGW